MKGMARRFAGEGITTFVPDLYRGSVAVTPDEASHLMEGMDWTVALEDISSSVGLLQGEGVEKVAALGFCLGGALTIAAACKIKGLHGGVVFYGVPPKSVCDPKDVACPLQLHFGQKDCSTGFSDPVTAASLEETLKAHGKPYDMYHYDADHAFMNECRSEVFCPAASGLAFQRSIEFIKSL